MEEEQAGVINAVTKAANTIPIDSEGKPPMTSSIKKVLGSELPIAYHSNQFRARYIDECTGEVLDPLMAQAAIVEELNDLNDRVWEVSTKDEMHQVPGHIFVCSK